MLLVSFITLSCNPVKQVLKDNSKFNIVAEEVIRRGYCVNDTIVETKIDTLYQSDSSAVNYITVTEPIDTTFADGAKLKIDSAGQVTVSCPVKVQYKTVTKTQTIRDKALENILRNDIAKLDSINSHLKLTVEEKQNQIKAVENKLLKRQLQLSGIIIALLAFVGFKLYTKFRSIIPF